MNNCSIVVPLYKPFILLNEDEIISLQQLYKVLGKKVIIFTGPLSLDWKPYKEHAKKSGVTISCKAFDEDYFKDIQSYSKLLISQKFYTAFKKFDYLLIYQTDAYVFRDELDHWCAMQYDYIGAPWFDKYEPGNPLSLDVGNGGFSLRNINSFLNLLKKARYLEVFEKYQNFNWKGFIPRLPSFFYKLYKARNTPGLMETGFPSNEDGFWCRYLPESLNKFNCNSVILQSLARLFIKNTFIIAPAAIAMKFSFEEFPRLLYDMNNQKLPFGCHAWQKCDPDFWKPFILADYNA